MQDLRNEQLLLPLNLGDLNYDDFTIHCYRTLLGWCRMCDVRDSVLDLLGRTESKLSAGIAWAATDCLLADCGAVDDD